MVYNRYVGNTGRFIRVEDEPAIPDRTDRREHADHRERSDHHERPDVREHKDERERAERRERVESHRSERTENPHQTPRGGGGLSSLLGGSGLSSLLGGKAGGLFGGKGLGFLDKILPFGMDTGDLALIVLFFFLYIESGDDEFLIIMAFLAYSIFKDRPK